MSTFIISSCLTLQLFLGIGTILHSIREKIMNSLVFQKMRQLSHAYVRQQINYYQQRLTLASRCIDKQASCKYNADSAFLLCAVNPYGPCSKCGEYEPNH